MDRATPFASPAARHFSGCMERFGCPIIVLNLVKVCDEVCVVWNLSPFALQQRREHREREMILTRELLEQVNYLNQFLPPDCQIVYIHKDMAKINKRLV